MRKLLLSLSVFALIACQDRDVTGVSVLNSSAASHSDDDSDHYNVVALGTIPPPPNDSGTAAASSEHVQRLETTYFFNVPGNSGWLMFQKTQASNVTIDKNARISYSKGSFSGTGSVYFTANGGTYRLNLATVSQSSSFNNSKNGWFNVVLGDATFRSSTGAVRTISGGVTLRVVKGGRIDGGSDGGSDGGVCTITTDSYCK